MLAAGPQLRGHKAGWAEACAVAELTMRRARTNVERLIALLREAGCIEPDDEPLVYRPPSAELVDRLDELESIVGVLPLSVRAWFEYVGELNLAAVDPPWDFEFGDPLQVLLPPLDDIRDEYPYWERGTDSGRRGERFEVDLSADAFHKAERSGGGPYCVFVPEPAVDGPLRAELHHTNFVGYLRISFQWAGFPGWDGKQIGQYVHDIPPVAPQIATWSEHLVRL
jgi:hypothetical protein